MNFVKHNFVLTKDMHHLTKLPALGQFSDKTKLTCLCILGYHTVFPRIIDRGRLFLYLHQKGAIISLFALEGGDYLREVIISNIAHGKSCPKYFFTSNTQSVLNMDFNSAPGLVP